MSSNYNFMYIYSCSISNAVAPYTLNDGFMHYIFTKGNSTIAYQLGIQNFLHKITYHKTLIPIQAYVKHFLYKQLFNPVLYCK